MIPKRSIFSNVEGKHILVAGAAGFVPGHVAEKYLESGAKVIGIDNFVTGDFKTIEILSKYENFSFYQCDISSGVPAELFKSNITIDWIYSMASPASPIDFQRIPVQIMRVNSEGTYNLLELARLKKARFLEASTSEIYGDPLIHPQNEEYTGNVNCIGPRGPYDESKRFAEALTMVYFRQYNVDTRIVRIFNTYGPRMRIDDGRVIPNFISQAINNVPITVYGRGEQTRSFCYIDDLVDYLHCVMTKACEKPVNIGTTQEFSVLEIAKKIKELSNSSSEIIFKSLPKDDPSRRRPDLGRLENIYKGKDSISLELGLIETINYLKKNWK